MSQYILFFFCIDFLRLSLIFSLVIFIMKETFWDVFYAKINVQKKWIVWVSISVCCFSRDLCCFLKKLHILVTQGLWIMAFQHDTSLSLFSLLCKYWTKEGEEKKSVTESKKVFHKTANCYCSCLKLLFPVVLPEYKQRILSKTTLWNEKKKNRFCPYWVHQVFMKIDHFSHQNTFNWNLVSSLVDIKGQQNYCIVGKL